MNNKDFVFAFLCNPGPGDALRFFHGFCEYIDSIDKHGIIYCLPAAWEKCKSLADNLSLTCKKGIELKLVNNIEQLNCLLVQASTEYIFHSFETEYYLPNTKVFPKVLTQNVSSQLIQIDRFCNKYYLKKRISNRLKLPYNGIAKNKGLIFLRLVNVVPERNISNNILKAVIEAFQKRNLYYEFSGSPLSLNIRNELNLKEFKELYPEGKYPDYFSQICEYAKYSFAIGMNSGALDLASVARIPIIRIGEYHHTVPHQGLCYNDFLFSNTSINILSNSETDISNIDEKIINKAFDYLFSVSSDIPTKIYL